MKAKYYLPLIHPKKLSFYPFIRVGGFGLGNMLFPFFRALTCSIRDSASLLYPHHNQFQPRNFLRDLNKDSLRNYSSDFAKFKWSSLPIINSLTIYYSRSWENESHLDYYPNILFYGYKNYFYDLIDHRDFIKNYIYYSFKISRKNPKNKVAFHLRLGDFLINKQNVNPEKVLESLNYFTKNLLLEVEIYSDSTLEQVNNFLGIKKLPSKTTLVKSLSPMHDLIKMSQAKYICGNPYSTFVEWAKFLSYHEQVSYSLHDKSISQNIFVSPIKWHNFL